MERPVHGVQQPEALRNAFLQVLGSSLERERPPYVDGREVHRGIAVGNPIGERPSDAPGRLKTHGVEARRHETPVDLR